MKSLYIFILYISLVVTDENFQSNYQMSTNSMALASRPRLGCKHFDHRGRCIDEEARPNLFRGIYKRASISVLN